MPKTINRVKKKVSKARASVSKHGDAFFDMRMSLNVEKSAALITLLVASITLLFTIIVGGTELIKVTMALMQPFNK